jgi:hypothetical protein
MRHQSILELGWIRLRIDTSRSIREGDTAPSVKLSPKARSRCPTSRGGGCTVTVKSHDAV